LALKGWFEKPKNRLFGHVRVKEGIDNKQSNIDIYETMVLKDPENAPRDHQQIRSKRYHDKQKDKHTAGSNLADQVLTAFALVNNNDFVQEAVYTNGNNKPPSLICYTKTQLDDMKLHLRNDVDCVVGFDRIFNFGPTFVTNLVYKNKKVVKKSPSDHPIFIGPVLFHWDANYWT
jgi:hypothetical protein